MPTVAAGAINLGQTCAGRRFMASSLRKKTQPEAAVRGRLGLGGLAWLSAY